MDFCAINASTNSINVTCEELHRAGLLSNEHAQINANHVILTIQMLGFAGVVFVFLVARHLVTVEKNSG